ncbi:phosphatidylinositol N-acetylglucosaminyltransferase subunit Q [Myzus persicae]|uniref:phosphatidylinositol N-acetylglucosaminyltransferase subunit Q n=1 Tax=Myzus persicae TaxID=13164 RepID=UPI000B9356BF|nr:phosphatidylinositol N-acetylglucosaminyltransferase subunit Q [Myzus persicae]
MEDKQVVFFPKTLLGMSDITVELLGFIELMKNVRYYFVLPNYIKNTNTVCKVKTIGHFTKTDCQACFKRRFTNILCITEINGNLNASLLPGQLDNFVLVIYDPSRLYDYGTLFKYEGDSQKFICFIMLSNWLSSTENVQEQYHLSKVVMFQRFAKYLLIILNVLINGLETKIVQLTILRLTLFKHILGVLKNYVWLVDNLIHNKHILSRAKSINYLMSCICDAVLGIIILYILNTSFTSSNELFSYISSISHQVIKVLQGILQWLMGSPAGLKLNDPLNSLLGTCFLYLVNLWWSFLVLCRPFLELTFQVYVFIGIFGLSYQIAIIEDVLAIVSFHVYCIYVYAAWLYNLQRKSLMILAKLFVGRSCNPQPGRTKPYTTQQLYVGTISFAILLFLLPTTLIYYIVFVVMRTIMVMARGILIRLRYVLQVLPVYTTLIWFVKPSSSAGIIKMNIVSNEKSSTVVLNTTIVADSWWATVKHYLPEMVEQPPSVSWITLTKRVCTGKILYPI